jgi:hypothetical protein
MTVALSVPLQVAVYEIVTGAIGAIPVFDHPPTNAPGEFVRLDGFNVNDLDFKNGEAARHSFEVHHFLRPNGEATVRGQKRSKQILGQAHAALMAAEILGTHAQFEFMDVSPDEDGVSTHGRARYTIVL